MIIHYQPKTRVARASARALGLWLHRNMLEVMKTEGTFVVSARNVIEDVDEVACSLVGYSKRELVGMHGSELVLEQERPATAVSVDRMRHGDLALRNARLRCKDGSTVDVVVRAQPLPDGRLALILRKRLSAET